LLAAGETAPGWGVLGLGSPGYFSPKGRSQQAAIFRLSHRHRISGQETHGALQGADKKLVKGLTGLVAVADILESLGGILAGNIEKNLLATSE
jgi:hypothetical protein